MNLDREPDMQDLRLIGVHEDGQHLLLADADGARYRLALDEPLRAAARRDRPRLGQLQIEIEGGLRPREVQALIRRGLSAEEVAERAGWTVEKVRRFEGPVLAEREHVAKVARECAVGAGPDGPVTLADRVGERLAARGVRTDEVDWDSARDEKGVWRVSATFAAGGRRRTATWTYEPLGGSVAPTDDEARWLGEEAVPGLPAPHAAPGAGEVDLYDVDAHGGIGAPSRPVDEPIDLVAAMRDSARGRRGRRRAGPSHTPGDDRPRDDALPIDDLTVDPAAAGPPPVARDRNPVAHHLDEPTPSRELVGERPEERPAREPRPATARREAAEPQRTEAPQRKQAATPQRKGRRSVPSWDDIVFGTKGGPQGG